MANNLYDKGREAFLTGQINWLSDTIKVALVGLPIGSQEQPYVGKTSGASSHQFLSSVPADNILSTVELNGKSATDGIADANDPTFNSVSGTITGIVLYKDAGTRETSRLIAYIDDINGIYHPANGDQIKISWDNDSNKIFKL